MVNLWIPASAAARLRSCITVPLTTRDRAHAHRLIETKERPTGLRAQFDVTNSPIFDLRRAVKQIGCAMLCDPVRFRDNVDVERDRRISRRGGAGVEWRAAVDE